MVCVSVCTCSQIVLAIISVDFLRQHKGVVFILFVWGLRCNRNMALFLKKHLRAVLNFNWDEQQFLQTLKAAYTKDACIMNSMTKLENVSHDDGVLIS